MRFVRAFALFLLSIAVSAPSAAAAQALYHVLKAGETVYSLARKYDVSSEAIVAANGITDASKLRPGQKLLIPAIHKVEKGDTLYGIAKSYGVGVDELRAANKLSANAVIRIGELLIVPGGRSAPAPADGSSVSSPPTVPPAAALAAPALPVPLVPPAVKTSSRVVDKKVGWPCTGEALYLDGKAQGVMIRSRLGEAETAVASGKVVAAGPFRGYGQMVIVASRTGYLYVYAGNESLSVKVGDTIRSGQELGRIGLDAKEGAPIAYFMVYRDRDAIDPAQAPRD
jgi:murein DD-endopeptidase MepM/ murein hydrolase activator NlpD